MNSEGPARKPRFGVAALAFVGLAVVAVAGGYGLIRWDLATTPRDGQNYGLAFSVIFKAIVATAVFVMACLGALVAGGFSLARKERHGWTGLLGLVVGGVVVAILLGVAVLLAVRRQGGPLEDVPLDVPAASSGPVAK